MKTTRRAVLQMLGTLGVGGLVPSLWAGGKPQTMPSIIKPPRLQPGDTVGLITPASPPFNVHQTLIAATEKMQNLGFRVKVGTHVGKKWGFLAGSDAERVADIHAMLRDPEVKALIAVRGGYGSARLLPLLDKELIRKHPKIIVGYSDITALGVGIFQLTGLVTFHGPVAISTFTDYTRRYFLEVLGNPDPVGEIADPPYEANLQSSNRVWTIRGGTAQGRLIGGNLTLLVATLGTPYEVDTNGRILFIEEVGEEPYDVDRMLTQLAHAGKLQQCAGIVFDRMPSIKPATYDPAFNSNLSVEEVVVDHVGKLGIPVCFGLSLGHVKHKPTLPNGILAELDADKGRLRLLEGAVV